MAPLNHYDFWAKSTGGFWYHIQEGTGDNLMQEDIDDGYVDYIYYDYYQTLNDVHEDSSYDGGIILLKQPYGNYSAQELMDMIEPELEVVE